MQYSKEKLAALLLESEIVVSTIYRYFVIIVHWFS